MHEAVFPSRRAALQRAAVALALAPWWRAQASSGAALAAAAPRWLSNPFSLGVASGQPRPDGVVLWTRLLPQKGWESEQNPHQNCAVNCEIYSDPQLRQRVRQVTINTDAARAHSVHVDASGLQPGQSYWYRFVCGDASSPVGRTRTAPAPDASVDSLRFALAACQHYEHGWFAAHREMAAQPLDFVLFVGDYIYESMAGRKNKLAPGIREHSRGVPRTLQAYRARHAQYKADPDLQACHAAHPWICTWDDHEVTNDYAAGLDPVRRDEDATVFLRRRAAAYQAYAEHMPLRLPAGLRFDAGGFGQLRIHNHFAWGQLADLWTLDNRQYRSLQACQDPVRGGGRVVLGCAELADPARTMLGAAQQQWLYDGLRQSRRAWKLIAQSTQISTTGMNTPLGRTAYTDGWDGYPAAREQLLRVIAEHRIGNVVTLGGDVHMNVAANLRLRGNDPASPIVASEIVTTSVSSRGLLEIYLQQIRASNPDIAHARADERGYTLLEVTPQQLTASFRVTPHPVAQDAKFHTQAHCLVRSGQPGVQVQPP